MRKYYVYLHFIEGESNPFYIGAASSRERAYNFNARSSAWHLISQKGKVKVVLHEVSSKLEAGKLESKFIDEYREHICNKEKSKPLPTTELLNPDLYRIPTELGMTIRILRIKQGLSTRDLARMADVSMPTINKIEKGDCRCIFTAYINILYILGVANALREVGYKESCKDTNNRESFTTPTRNRKGYKLYDGKTKGEYLKSLKSSI